MNTIGLDLSLTGTGLSCPDNHIEVIRTKPADYDQPMARLRSIREQIVDHFGNAELAIVEAPSFGSLGRKMELGELSGVIKMALFTHQIPYVMVAPLSLKKFLTGKAWKKDEAGKKRVTTKYEMQAAAIAGGYKGPAEENCIDAWALQQVGLYKYGQSILKKTQYREDVIEIVEWPL